MPKGEPPLPASPDVAVSIRRVTRLLARCVRETSRRKDGRIALPLAAFFKLYALAYPAAPQNECQDTLKVLADLRAVEITPKDELLFDAPAGSAA